MNLEKKILTINSQKESISAVTLMWYSMDLVIKDLKTAKNNHPKLILENKWFLSY